MRIVCASLNYARHTAIRLGAVWATFVPGATATQFAARAGVNHARLYHARVMSAQRVALLGYRAFKNGRRVQITGLGNALLVLAGRVSPRRMVLKIARWQMRTQHPHRLRHPR